VDKVALSRGCLQEGLFSPLSIIPPMRHLRLLPKAWNVSSCRRL